MNDPTSISIIITTCGKTRNIADVLRSLKGQRFQGAAQVIVVNNRPENDSRQEVEKFQLPINWTLLYLEEPKAGKVFALNAALQRVSNKLVCFLDDDVRFDPDLLQAYFNAAHTFPECDYFGGPVMSYKDGEPPHQEYLEGRHRLYLAWPVHELGSSSRAYRKGESPMGANRMMRMDPKKPFQFPTYFAEKGLRLSADDMWIGEQWHEENKTMMYIPEAKVWHRIEADNFNLSNLSKRYFAFGKYQYWSLQMKSEKKILAYKYLIRDLLSHLISCIVLLLKRQHTKSRYFYCEMIRECGQLVEVLKNRSSYV